MKRCLLITNLLSPGPGIPEEAGDNACAFAKNIPE